MRTPLSKTISSSYALAIDGCLALLPGVAQAQAQGDTTSSGAPPVVQPSATAALPDQSAAPAPGRFQTYDALNFKGWDIPFPKTEDSILADKGGVRDALADIGIGIFGFGTTAFQDAFVQNDHGYRGAQVYNGQNLTRTNSDVTIFATYDLGRIGLAGGQLQFAGLYISNSFAKVDGPSDVRVARLAYYQSLFDKALEIKIGYTDNSFEFLGANTGGSIAAGNLGPQATIPYEVGLSYGDFGTPTLNIRANFKGHFYDKIGFQRSLLPGGNTVELPLNGSGLRFRPPGTGLLIIDEVGWNVKSAPGVMSTWVRGGGIYNTTNFKSFRDGREKKNWAFYAAADRQISQFDASKPYRGVYVGATVDYAPPAQNLYTQYYEARIYGEGVLAGRPFDLATLVATRSVYSPAGLLALTPAGHRNYRQTTSLIGSYAFHLIPGVYLQPGLGVTEHPVFTPRFGTAVNGYLTISVFI